MQRIANAKQSSESYMRSKLVVKYYNPRMGTSCSTPAKGSQTIRSAVDFSIQGFHQFGTFYFSASSASPKQLKIYIL